MQCSPAATGRSCALGRRRVLRSHLLRLRQAGLGTLAVQDRTSSRYGTRTTSLSRWDTRVRVLSDPRARAEVRAESPAGQRNRQLACRGLEPRATLASPCHQQGWGQEVTFPDCGCSELPRDTSDTPLTPTPPPLQRPRDPPRSITIPLGSSPPRYRPHLSRKGPFPTWTLFHSGLISSPPSPIPTWYPSPPWSHPYYLGLILI